MTSNVATVNGYHAHVGRRDEAAALVIQHHYSHRAPLVVIECVTWHEPGGLLGDMGEPVAAAVFGSATRRWTDYAWELKRLVRTPSMGVPLTGLISQALRAIKGRPKFPGLVVSYADIQHGHHGGIYQAASWNYHGARARSDEGMLIDGVFVPKRTVSTRFGTFSLRAVRELAGGVPVSLKHDEGKHLYWKALNKRGVAAAKAIGLECKPYPKPDVGEAEA